MYSPRWLWKDAPEFSSDTNEQFRLLTEEIYRLGVAAATSGDIATAADGDTSPDVTHVHTLFTGNTAATNVTTFDGAQVGQHLTVIFSDANTTLVHGAGGIILTAGVNFTGTVGDVKQFVRSNSDWREIPQP